MIFKKNGEQLEVYTEYWSPSEKEIEDLIISSSDKENLILKEDIFGEEFFFIGNQIIDKNRKRLDMIALDKNANGVIIELKKDKGQLGVDMQALQYLSSNSQYKGKEFIKKYKLFEQEELLESFFNDEVHIDDINRKSRIVLLARYFDNSLFSMGSWLSEQGISFKCISYDPISVRDEKFISFSVVNDQPADTTQYKARFNKARQENFFFWHNLGGGDEPWFEYLFKTGQITASYSNQEGDRGEEILRNYTEGDRIFAYGSGVGCIGYGTIEKLDYRLIEPGSSGDVFPKSGHHLHRLSIKWKYTLGIKDAINANELRSEYKIAHPIQTSSKIKRGDTDKLLSEMKRRMESKIT